MSFFSRFTIFFGIPYLLLNAFPFAPVLESIATIQRIFLERAGFSVFQNGVFLQTASQTYQIVPSCTGLVMVFLVVSLLYSTPVKDPFRFAVLFAPALLLANQFRLFLVIALGTLYPMLQEAVHVYFWFVDAALVLVLWWLAFASSLRKETANGSRVER